MAAGLLSVVTAALLAVALAGEAPTKVHSSAVHFLKEEPRPNLTEWKEQQANASAVKAEAAANQSKMAAVDKAVELLERLHSQVVDEGEAEAKTYNKFACFCKDTTAEKQEAIQNGQDQSTTLTAAIGELASKRTGLDDDIKTAQGEIDLAEKEMKEAAEQRAATKKVYDGNTADLKGALAALEGAIASLKASKTPSLAQLDAVKSTVRTAALLADALGLGKASTRAAAAALLQQEPEDDAVPENKVQMEDYKFHSGSIVKTLEDLLDDFRSQKTEVDKQEVESIRAYDMFIQEKTHHVQLETHKLETAKKARAKTIDDIAVQNQELSTVAATLLEDQQYLDKLYTMCNQKAKTWDQRTSARAAELSTLTQAIGIIKGAVSAKTSASTIRFAQTGSSLRVARAIAMNAASMRAIEAEAESVEAEDAAAPALVQVRQQQRVLRGSAMSAVLAPKSGDAREFVSSLLRTEGQHLKSAVLTALAGKIAADPFAKVKQLIQELIERLLQEASNEANQKGWCDKATSDAKQKRDYAAEEIRGLNGEMAKLEAMRNQLAEELATLQKAIKEIQDAQEEATAERAAEKKQNENTIAEAQAGLDALNMCIDLLDKFYKTMTKETVDLSLVQRSEPEIVNVEDAPDAGFESGEAYSGAQSESGGILAMLDVMKSDFTRTIEETQIAEAQAVQDHLAFMTESGKSLAQKEEAESQTTAQKQDAEGKLSDADTELGTQTDLLKESISELLQLKPACVDTGMSYEQRVAAREDEIAALNKAMCILGRYEEYGPEGAADGC